MAVFKCKMCGGALEINNNETVVTCEYCGTQQTLPKLDDDRRANLYDRANHFRRNNEFDKAMGIYEQILNEDNTDAEAYWSLVLCRYGIEYVEDPSSHKRIPTVNRAQFTSVFDDDNYKSALQYADGYQRSIYEEEAKAINEIQKGILAISQKEEPFDVFICYKETDNNGRRTPDSVLANDLYHQLTQEGFTVFFARITLEDKLGSAYEPYIFAALNSAKVMVVLGTKPDYFNAVWVKNEWSRYLALIKQGQKKMLIPAYKDMDPYDLPEEFSHLQAQDMSKLGFMQDLIRGIKKITQADTPKTTVVKETVISGGNANTAPLLKRAFMFLEDGDWISANEYCEKVLDIDPECGEAYLGKLLSELRVRKQESLKDQAEPFDSNNNYQKAIRFADDTLKAELVGCIEHINTRNEQSHLERTYKEAVALMNNAYHTSTLENAANSFVTIADYKDARALAEQCRAQAKDMHRDAMLEKADLLVASNYLADMKEAARILEEITGWKNADELADRCRHKIVELTKNAEIKRKKAEEQAKRKRTVIAIVAPIVCAVIVLIILMNTVIIPNDKYNDAIALMDAGKYTEAISAFEALNGYKDSENKINDCTYSNAESLLNQGDTTEAYLLFRTLGGHRDSMDRANNIQSEMLKNCTVGEYIMFGAYEQDNNAANGKEEIEWLVLDVKDGNALVISKYALDCMPYHNTDASMAKWKNCTIRKWLNEDFLDAAFSAEDKGVISVQKTVPDENIDKTPREDNHPYTTYDKLFLLSNDEATYYFSSDEARVCYPTQYALANGAYTSTTTGACWWWIRTARGMYFEHASPPFIENEVQTVNFGGECYEYGRDALDSRPCVRPAMWIDLSKIRE